METNPVIFDWVKGILTFLLLVGIGGAVSLVVSFLVCLLLFGPKGAVRYFDSLFHGIVELLTMSPKRVLAITTLVLRESLRRKTLLVIVVFAVLFLFGSWFLPSTVQDSEGAVKHYVSFVLTAISWLVLPSVFLLACWGLPDDIKARSLHTVVTKPVPRSEVLLGRVLGVVSIGTGIFLLMTVFGYFWLVRAVPVNENGVSPLTARVPVWGDLRFVARDGTDAAAGVNVGDIDARRSFIEGNTKARAIWEFSGVTPARFGADGLKLENTMQVFRTHKGNIDSGIYCQLTFVNPTKGTRAVFPAFTIREFRRGGDNVKDVPRKLQNEQNQNVDLYDDIVENGKLRIEAACLSGGQYLGMAPPDLFLRLPDASFASSYVKAALGIWLMMVLLIVLGVCTSCFLKGPVTMILLGTFLLLGSLAKEFMQSMFQQGYEGGGPFESVVRVLQHSNPSVAMEETTTTTVVQFLDKPFFGAVWVVNHMIPDLQSFNLADYTANGFDVAWNTALSPLVATTIGFVIPIFLIGFFSLRARELEAK